MTPTPEQAAAALGLMAYESLNGQPAGVWDYEVAGAGCSLRLSAFQSKAIVEYMFAIGHIEAEPYKTAGGKEARFSVNGMRAVERQKELTRLRADKEASAARTPKWKDR